ncbi:MAG: sigma-54 dependent transcriptional regulator [Calditrichia bacterium]
MKKILIVDNEEKFCKVVQEALRLENLPADYVTSGEAALEWLQKNSADVVVTDMRMQGIDGLQLLREIKKKNPDIEVVLMTAYASQKTAVEALKDGAYDYLIKPFDMDELILRIRRILNQKKLVEENRLLRASGEEWVTFDRLVGRSQKMRKVYQLIQKAASSNSTVLIRGESGTGKELVAEVLHANSDRKNEPFIAINCAALPENLLESELFGYEKGAFTGANQRQIGKFELAGKGTIFLDEIGDLSLSTQVKLLRVLQNKEFYRLGGKEKIVSHARVIAATHKNLEKMIEAGQFRQDLFYRLNVFPIYIPPLREHKEDIPELVNHFLKQTQLVGIDREALKILIQYDWPGNVRELQNVIERASILAESVIVPADLPPLKSFSEERLFGFELPDANFNLDEFEKNLIIQALKKANGNKTQAAGLLGITRRRLYSMMQRFGIES